VRWGRKASDLVTRDSQVAKEVFPAIWLFLFFTSVLMINRSALFTGLSLLRTIAFFFWLRVMAQRGPNHHLFPSYRPRTQLSEQKKTSWLGFVRGRARESPRTIAVAILVRVYGLRK